jgi:hypothetical protein
MPQQYDSIPIEERSFRIEGSVTGLALADMDAPMTLAQVAELSVGDAVEYGGVTYTRMG